MLVDTWLGILHHIKVLKIESIRFWPQKKKRCSERVIVYREKNGKKLAMLNSWINHKYRSYTTKVQVYKNGRRLINTLGRSYGKRHV